ncbi:S41 family peptidase [Pseudozobellia thermophila]|uniref:Peptidase family S41 n=1 Tax=Pseudozobellia thermophila TaxID=192903 RepID=A0A1M6FFZ6_9FLAO|nr:S41 family peptidase [Pseudozobellia thermophila]SHI96532.1 Peptidase family S41 [Pseudozobellia thermophila]
MKKFSTGILLSLLLFVSCVSDDDFSIPDTVDPDPEAGVHVQDFMWKAMNFWYFWQADVENLSDTKFPDTEEGSRAYTEFLASESDPGKFFDNQLLYSEDRFSFYSDDYVTLTQSLSGISKSNGLIFGLVRIKNSSDIFGYVQYIVPGSDASEKDIERGDIFIGVDGTSLTDTNYVSLLFGDSDSYTLNMADIIDGQLVANDKEVSLVKEVGLQENPILLDEIIEIGGAKVGYLVYTGFTDEFDEELNKVFGRFKSGGVTDLVLDLRYNPGGSVNTAILLSSMIYGTNTKEVFLKARYNDKYQKILEDNDTDLRRFFADKTGDGTQINTLNLSKVYILTTSGTASASELVINGLTPYIDVVQIGETTRGKNEFSTTMVDDRDNNYLYSPDRTGKINDNNKWAIQPLLGRNENADGFSDFTSGLVPDIEMEEDLTNLGILGDLNEPLLARALDEITGNSAKRQFTTAMPARTLTTSKMFAPLKDNMYVKDLPVVW